MPRNSETGAPLSGLVLAGGASSRMKRDKASLNYSGQPEFSRAAGLLQRHCRRVIVSVAPSRPLRGSAHDYEVLEDTYEGIGPLAGLLTAMREYPGEAWLAVPCDMPLLDEATVATLVSGRAPSRLATAFIGGDGRPEPLCAIYEPASYDVFVERLRDGNSSLRAFLETGNAARITCDDTGALRGVNTPEEAARVRERLDARMDVPHGSR